MSSSLDQLEAATTKNDATPHLLEAAPVTARFSNASCLSQEAKAAAMDAEGEDLEEDEDDDDDAVAEAEEDVVASGERTEPDLDDIEDPQLVRKDSFRSLSWHKHGVTRLANKGMRAHRAGPRRC